MTNTHLSLAHLTDSAVIDEVTRRAQDERQSTAGLVAALAELDARRLYFGQGCSSLFTYCTRVLHLSEHAAYGRIEAARAARKYPVVLEMLAAGDLTLTALGLLAPHLTPENHRDLLLHARHRPKREVEELVAAIRPLPDVRPLVRKEPAPRTTRAPLILSASGSSAPTVAPPTLPERDNHVGSDVRTAPDPRPKPIIKPLAPERYKVQVTVSRETIETLRRVQDLMRHVVPDGDPAVIIGRALRLLLEDLEKRRMASVARPREQVEGVGAKVSGDKSRSRHIPAAVRRAVWARDGGRCAFIGAIGGCAETGLLEYHHVHPFGDGGEASVENIELRCRAHNQYEADLFFGPLIARERRAAFAVNSVQTELTLGTRGSGLGARGNRCHAFACLAEAPLQGELAFDEAYRQLWDDSNLRAIHRKCNYGRNVEQPQTDPLPSGTSRLRKCVEAHQCMEEQNYSHSVSPTYWHGTRTKRSWYHVIASSGSNDASVGGEDGGCRTRGPGPWWTSRAATHRPHVG